MIDFIFANVGAVGDADAQAHFGDIVPAAHFIGGFLGLEIKINDMFGHGAVSSTIEWGRAPFKKFEPPGGCVTFGAWR